MSSSLYLTRARVREHVPAAALRELLLPDDASRRAGAGHKLVWTLFADAPDRRRDFLWRETNAGVFYILSRREPNDQHGLFDLDPSKTFAPVLAAGDRLAFSLRANATVAKPGGRGVRGKRADVVMAAIKDVPGRDRAAARTEAVQQAGRKWLDAQGDRCGFTIESVGAIDYRTLDLERAGPAARIGVLDFDGVLTVREPAGFVEALGSGFGRAKAFGCGLMLVRRT